MDMTASIMYSSAAMISQWFSRIHPHLSVRFASELHHDNDVSAYPGRAYPVFTRWSITTSSLQMLRQDTTMENHDFEFVSKSSIVG